MMRFQIDSFETSPRIKIQAHYQIRNFGHGPALKISPVPWVVVPGAKQDADHMAESICDSAIKFATGTVPSAPRINPGPLGYVLFPDGKRTEKPSWQDDANSRVDNFEIMACVAYLDQFNTAHWARFCMTPDIFAPRPVNKDTPP
jgi:hypothetical protein